MILLHLKRSHPSALNGLSKKSHTPFKESFIYKYLVNWKTIICVIFTDSSLSGDPGGEILQDAQYLSDLEVINLLYNYDGCLINNILNALAVIELKLKIYATMLEQLFVLVPVVVWTWS